MWARCGLSTQRQSSTDLEHEIEKFLPASGALAVADHVEVEDAERLQLAHLFLVVEQKQVLATNLQHADCLALTAGKVISDSHERSDHD